MRKQFVVAGLIFAACSTLSAQTPVERGKALMDARKYSEAKEILQPLGKRDATAAFYLGQIAMEQNDVGKSVDWLEKAVAMNPQSSVYYDWLGRAYGVQAQRASKFKLPFLAGKTRSAWERAIALDPNNLDARDDMILFYLEAPGFLGGGKEKARAMAQEIRKRNPYRGSVAWARVCGGAKDRACTEREVNFLMSTYPDSSLHVTRRFLRHRKAVRQGVCRRRPAPQGQAERSRRSLRVRSDGVAHRPEPRSGRAGDESLHRRATSHRAFGGARALPAGAH